MLKFKKITLNLLVFLGLVSFTAKAIDEPANNQVLEDCRSMIQNLGNDAIKTLKGSKDNRRQREEQFRPLFVKNFDVEKIGKFVLGKYGRGNIKPEEFKEFLDIFQKTIVSIYANRLGKYDDEKFVVKDATYVVNEPNEKLVKVESRVLSKDKNPINIAWSIVVKNDHSGIVDVTIEGVSQAFTQQQEYGDTLRNGGIRELITKLKNKYEKTSGTNPN